MLQVLEIIQNSRALEGRATQPSADCNSTQKSRARGSFYLSLGYKWLVSKYSTKFEKGFARQELQMEAARCKVLKKNGENCVFKFSWWR